MGIPIDRVCSLKKRERQMIKRYRHVAVGGTFDLLHPGHIKLLEKALEIAERITVGLTTDEMVSQMYKNHDVEDYETRLSRLKSFLSERGVSGRTEIIALEDSFGPTVIEADFDAVVVSRETLLGAERINEIRGSKRMIPLGIVVIDMVLDEDEVPISSTRIRQGIIDRWGRLKERDRFSS